MDLCKMPIDSANTLAKIEQHSNLSKVARLQNQNRESFWISQKKQLRETFKHVFF